MKSVITGFAYLSLGIWTRNKPEDTTIGTFDQDRMRSQRRWVMLLEREFQTALVMPSSRIKEKIRCLAKTKSPLKEKGCGVGSLDMGYIWRLGK